MYRIATTRCLNILRSASRRPAMTPAAGSPAARAVPAGRGASGLSRIRTCCWRSCPTASAGPEARYEAKEAMSLAFVTALQLLPPRQRAALILRDVLDFPASEVAGMLDTTEQSVTSALKRARSTLSRELPSADAEPPPPPNSAAEQRAGGPPGRGVRGGRRGRHRGPDDRGRLAADAAGAAGVPGPGADRRLLRHRGVPAGPPVPAGPDPGQRPARLCDLPARPGQPVSPRVRAARASRWPATRSARSPASTTPRCPPSGSPGRWSTDCENHPAAWLLLLRCSARSGYRGSRRQSSPADAWPASARSPSAWPPAGSRPASRFAAAAWKRAMSP